VIGLAAFVLSLPLRIAWQLGIRRTLIVGCLLVLAITGYGVADDLGLLDDAPAHARGRPDGQAAPSRAATADIPPSYLRPYRSAVRRCAGLSWAVLAAVGKVESDHGRARLPGVRSGWNPLGAAGPMQFGIGQGRAGNAWARYGHDYNHDGQVSVYDPGDAVPAAADYLCAHGAPHRLDAALYAYNPSWAYVARVKQLARRYLARGDGRR
jgi:peptidoglycan DL-endopeptidase CwlO